MIQLTYKTSVALLLLVLKQNYGKSWVSEADRDGFIAVGMHLPTGEVAYFIPEEYREYTKGMIQLDDMDLLGLAPDDTAAQRILNWTKEL